jgi:hypothetical protein
MLGWLKKKKQAPELSNEEKLLSHPIIGSAIRARWIAKLVAKYIAEISGDSAHISITCCIIPSSPRFCSSG